MVGPSPRPGHGPGRRCTHLPDMRFPAPSSSSQSSTFPAASHRSDKVEPGAGPRSDNPPEDAEDRRKNPDVSAVHEAQGIKQGQGQDLTSASSTSSVVA